MKPLKIFGPLIVLAIMAGLATSASATVMTSPAGTIYTGEAQASSIGNVVMSGSNGVKTECVKKSYSNFVADGAFVTVKSTISNTSYTCSTGTVHVKKNGTYEFHSTGGGGGTVTISGSELEKTTETIFGTITCIYTTTNTSFGTFTGSNTTGGKARLDINATIPRTGGSSLCGSTGVLTGTMQFDSPSYLTID